MSTTSTDLIQESVRYLYSTSRDPQNKLNGAIDSATGTLSMLYPVDAARAGAVLALDLELLYVWEVVNEGTSTLTVERGYLGSVPAAHSDATLVTVNPKFSQFAILEALNADLDDLSGFGLFQVQTSTVIYNPSVQGYDIAPNVLEILQVKYDESGPGKLWPEIRSYKLRRASDTGDFASGNALVVYDSGQPGADLRITYGAPFTHFSALGEQISTTGLPSTANDLPPLGAALRLQYMREGQRNFNEAQPSTRRADEVAAGAQLTAARGLQQIRRDRIRVETNRLRKIWPNKRRLA
jgi:hypothetical protein